MKEFLPVSIVESRDYFQAIREYLGLPDFNIFEKLEMLENKPKLKYNKKFIKEATVNIENRITFEEITKLLDTSKLEIDSIRPQLASFIWLVANMYYGESYSLLVGRYVSDSEDPSYYYIRKEVLQLFIALNSYSLEWKTAPKDLIAWETSWKEAKSTDLEAKKKCIIKDLEKDYGEPQGERWKEWESIYANIADSRIYNAVQQEMQAEKDWKKLDAELRKKRNITIRFGKQKPVVKISNYENWVNDLFENHIYPRFIPDIKTIEDAKMALKKPSGRPSEDIRVRTLSYGLSNFFFDNNIVKSRTSSTLLSFLVRLLRMMDIRCNNGKYPDRKKVEDAIQNAATAKVRPRFRTEDDHRAPVSLESLATPSQFDIIRWLKTPEILFPTSID